MNRKEMSKIICQHLRKDNLVDGVSETYLISSIMDALKEIKEKEKCYLIICDWKEYYEGSVDILGKANSKDEALKIFQEKVEKEKCEVEKRGWDIIEDTKDSFEAEWEEEWSGNYTKLYIQKA